MPGARTPREAAESFLRLHARALDLSESLGELRAGREVESLTRLHFTYEQVYRGFPVEGGRLSVHVSRRPAGRDLAVELVNADLHPIGRTVPLRPHGISASAISAAVRQVGLTVQAGRAVTPTAPPAAEAVVFVEKETPIAAWKVTFQTLSPPADWVVIVEAQTHRILSLANRAQYETGEGLVFDPNPVVTSGVNNLSDGNDADSTALNNQRISVTLQGLDATGKLQGVYCTTAPTVAQARANSPTRSFKYTRADDRFEEVMCYYHIDTMQRYIQSLGFTNVNNRQVGANVNGVPQDNSYYSPGTKQVTFGRGGVDDAEDADVIYHEMGHAIQDNQVPGFGSSAEAAAMGEGFADYWAGSHSAGVGPNAPAWDRYIAEWDAVSYNAGNPAYLRRLDSTKRYPDSIRGEKHADGEIWSASLWKIRALVGRARADTMILESHFSVSPDAIFSDGAFAILDANNALYGGADQAAIRQVFIDRGILDSVPSPSSLKAALEGNNSAKLTWNDNSENEEGFRIERKTANGAFEEIAVAGANQTSFTDPGLAAATSYTYRVRSYKGQTSSRYSNTASVTTSIPLYSVAGTVTKGGVALQGAQVEASASGDLIYQQELSPGPAIPDNDVSGVTSSLTVTQAGTLTKVKVGVNITHPWRGDLDVTLIHPDGTTVLLHDRTGTTEDNLITLYPDLTQPAQSLAALNGKSMKGTWKLKVRDLVAYDTGKINSWSVTLFFTGSVSRSTTSASNGAYTISGLQSAAYTLVPSKGAEKFTPASRSATLGPDRLGQDFDAEDLAASELTLTPSSVVGGQTTTGTAVIGVPAPSGGTVVALSSDRPEAIVPASVTVPEGKTRATFIVTTTDVPSDVTATISALISGVTKQAGLAIKRNDLASLRFSPPKVIGGRATTGFVVLMGPAPVGGKVVTLSSDRAEAAVPASVTVPAGETKGTFTVTTTRTDAEVTANISATLNVTITQALPIVRIYLDKLTLNPNSLTGGSSSTGTVTLNEPALSGGALVALSSNRAEATLPASVLVPAGQTTATFTVNTSESSNNVVAVISAIYNFTRSKNLNIRQVPLVSVQLSPSTVWGGSSSSGKVTLAGPAPAGGIVVTLSSNVLEVSVPASVTVAGGQTTASFTATSSVVSSSVTATITAKSATVTKTATLTVLPNKVKMLVISPNPVKGGSSTTGKVTLSGPAGAGGEVVALGSDKSQATVPPTMTVPAGATEATFTVKTSTVSSKVTAIIKAALGGAQKSTPLKIDK